MIPNQEQKITENGFAARLRELRKKTNLSQAAFAKIVGLHSIHISRYERGISKPNSGTLKRLAEAFGVTTDYLIEGKTTEAAKDRLDDKELLKMFIDIESLPKEDKFFVKRVIDALLTKEKIQELARR
jgi:transcriptional regulator with XRE-family HTH domain